MTDEDTTSGDMLTRVKAVGDLLRQFGLLVLLALLFFNPSWVKSWVHEAGIRKIGDLEFTESDAKRVEQAQQQLNDQRQVIAKLGDEMAAAQKVLEQAQTKAMANGLGSAAEIVSGLPRAEEAVQLARQSEKQITHSLAVLQPLVHKVEPLTLASDDAWSIVFGGDVSLDAAQDEVKRLQRAGLGEGSVMVFLRDKSYRTVVRYPSREVAEQDLGRLRGLRDSAYLVNLDRWCTSMEEKDGFTVCN